MKRTILNAGMILCGEQLTPIGERHPLSSRTESSGKSCPGRPGRLVSMEDAKEISLPHMTLMPGMIECHNHLCIDASPSGTSGAAGLEQRMPADPAGIKGT